MNSACEKRSDRESLKERLTIGRWTPILVQPVKPVNSRVAAPANPR